MLPLLNVRLRIHTSVHMYTGDADSDALDDVLRPIFADASLCQRYNVGSGNSVNWGRIVGQIAHWIYLYLKVSKKHVSTTGAAGV
jgi:threonine synthase